MSNYYLSEDLLLNVLSRLPVKSLKRFQCISKQWKALIKSPEFINLHLKRSSVRVIIGTARAAVGLPERYYLSSAEAFGTKESFLRTREEVRCPLEDFPGRNSHICNKRIRIVGYCNGLTCIQFSKYDVLVWNPWIRKHWIIPRTGVQRKLAPNCRKELPYNTFTYGFGYDDLNDDYKVVRIVQLQTRNSLPIGVEVKLFSMKSSLWRRIQDFPYTSLSSSVREVNLGSGVLVNGALHWVLSKYGFNLPTSVLAIDLATEKHRLLPVPDQSGILPDQSGKFCLSTYYGKLCFLTHQKMWVMEKDSWRVRIAIGVREDVSLYNMQPIAYSANERILVLHTDRELLWFNCKRLIREVNLHGGAFCDIFCSLASLVEPKCGDKKGTKRTKKDLKRKDMSLENAQVKKRATMV